MNLLITGGCGFIGSNFINNIDFDVNLIVNLDAMYYCASESNVTLRSNYKFIKGNLQDFNLISFILKEYQITHIIHFAAQSHVQGSFDNSLQYSLDNIIGTHTLLECCRLNCKQIEKIIHVSTDEVYGESLNDDQKTESSVLIPTNPYAATKAGAELIAMSYIKSYKLPILITRGNNVYGPNQYPEKLIPRFIKQLKSSENVTIQGDGSALRSFLHVDDTCSAFKILLFEGKVGEIYNIGTHDEYSVLEVAEKLIKLIKGPNVDIKEYIDFIEDRPFNDSRYFINNDKLVNLGWKIKIAFDDGLSKLI